MTVDTLVVAVMLGSGLVFGAAAAVALGWAAGTHQFENPGRAAEAIFDADEPVGGITEDFTTKAQSSHKASQRII